MREGKKNVILETREREKERDFNKFRNDDGCPMTYWSSPPLFVATHHCVALLYILSLSPCRCILFKGPKSKIRTRLGFRLITGRTRGKKEGLENLHPNKAGAFRATGTKQTMLHRLKSAFGFGFVFILASEFETVAGVL